MSDLLLVYTIKQNIDYIIIMDETLKFCWNKEKRSTHCRRTWSLLSCIPAACGFLSSAQTPLQRQRVEGSLMQICSSLNTLWILRTRLFYMSHADQHKKNGLLFWQHSLTLLCKERINLFKYFYLNRQELLGLCCITVSKIIYNKPKSLVKTFTSLSTK